MPVYMRTSGVRDEDLRIGVRLKAARQQHGLTLRTLAETIGISVAGLSQIENERKPVDVSQAFAIARALGVPLESLLPEDTSAPYQVMRDDELRRVEPRHLEVISATGRSRTHDNRFFPLAGRFSGRHLEPVRGWIAPARQRPEPMVCARHEQEFVVVLRGEIELRLETPRGVESATLGPGDSAYFWSSLPHGVSAAGQEPAETLHVFSSSESVGNPLLFAPRADAALTNGDRTTGIARRLRACRMAAGLSTAGLAALVDVSPRRLDLAEKGLRPLSLVTLLRMADVLAQPLRRLIGDDVRPPYVFVQRAADIMAIPRQRRQSATVSRNIFRSLARDFPERRMYPFLIEVPNTTANPVAPHEHHGEEFIYVLSGQVELTIGRRGSQATEVLHAGDVCYIDATVPHALPARALNPYDTKTGEVLDVFWCPLGEHYLFDLVDSRKSVV